ncbi:hypothetical protein H6G96_32595 [Nostoc sp. FACHB-892]|uniref:hypothetical protein n=1 Tax=Nostoc sp. FACHB-892 TaxID=2692843 RepID=UPI0016843426|nr:hypothetical protein [Nostoc sp. FACHB-892]MBD2730932.1 hypothetical protein [Nostoc sp. FACHB-892]
MLESSYDSLGAENSTSQTSLKRQWNKDITAKELVSDWRDEIINLFSKGIKEPSLIIYKIWNKKPAKGLYIKIRNELRLLLKDLS